MALTFNGVTKVITLTAGTTAVSVRDIWSRWVDWFLTSDNSKYLPAFEFVGGNDIDVSSGTKIPIYAFLMNGWKIKPQEANHTLTVGDGVLLVNGGGDPFNNTTGAYIVRINYQQPVQAISFASGGTGGLTVDESTQLAELHKLLGLKTGSPVQITKNGQLVDDITLEFSGDGTNDLTINRV